MGTRHQAIGVPEADQASPRNDLGDAGCGCVRDENSDFLRNLGESGIGPPVTMTNRAPAKAKAKGRKGGARRRLAHRVGQVAYELSQRVRKRVEHVFGVEDDRSGAVENEIRGTVEDRDGRDGRYCGIRSAADDKADRVTAFQRHGCCRRIARCEATPDRAGSTRNAWVE